VLRVNASGQVEGQVYRVLDVEGDPGSRRGSVHADVWKVVHISDPGTEGKVSEQSSSYLIFMFVHIIPF